MFEYPTICPFCGGTSIESAEENISTLGDPEMNGADVFDLVQFICTQCDRDFFCAKE